MATNSRAFLARFRVFPTPWMIFDLMVPVLIAVVACVSGAEGIALRSAAKSPETLRAFLLSSG